MLPFRHSPLFQKIFRSTISKRNSPGLFPPQGMPNGVGFVTAFFSALSNPVRQPFAPLKEFRVARAQAAALGPGFRARPKDHCDAPNQIIYRLESNNPAKNHVTD